MNLKKDFELGVQSFLKPTELALQLKKTSTFMKGLKILLVFILILTFLFDIDAAITLFASGELPLNFISVPVLAIGLLVVSIILLVFFLVLLLMDSWVSWFVGSLLGGKAEFGEYFGAIVYPVGVSIIGMSGLTLLSSLTKLFFMLASPELGLDIIFGNLYGLIYLGISFWGFYVGVVFLKEIHKISMLKAFISAISFFVIIGVIAVVLATTLLMPLTLDLTGMITGLIA
ncbi:YIP1 family protein [archaeon]|nr:YIP1 family protein [archaeon]